MNSQEKNYDNLAFLRLYILKSSDDFLNFKLDMHEGTRHQEPGKKIHSIESKTSAITTTDFRNSLSLNSPIYKTFLISNISDKISDATLPLLKKTISQNKHYIANQITWQPYTENNWKRHDCCRDVWIDEALIPEEIKSSFITGSDGITAYLHWQKSKNQTTRIYRADYNLLCSNEVATNALLETIFEGDINIDLINASIESILNWTPRLQRNEEERNQLASKIADKLLDFARNKYSMQDFLNLATLNKNKKLFHLINKNDKYTSLLHEHVQKCETLINNKITESELISIAETATHPDIWPEGEKKLSTWVINYIRTTRPNSVGDKFVQLATEIAFLQKGSDPSNVILDFLIERLINNKIEIKPKNLCTIIALKVANEAKNHFSPPAETKSTIEESVTYALKECKSEERLLLSKLSEYISRGEYRHAQSFFNSALTLTSPNNKLTSAMIQLCLTKKTPSIFLDLLKTPKISCLFPETRSYLLQHYIKFNLINEATEIVELITRSEPDSIEASNAKEIIYRTLKIKNIISSGISSPDLNSLQGKEFEELIARAFEAIGFSVMLTPLSGDFGADIIINDADGTKYIVQCKRFNQRVNLKAVQEVTGAISHYCADFGIVITNNSYLNSAIKLAESNGIELWTGREVERLLNRDISFSKVMNINNL